MTTDDRSYAQMFDDQAVATREAFTNGMRYAYKNLPNTPFVEGGIINSYMPSLEETLIRRGNEAYGYTESIRPVYVAGAMFFLILVFAIYLVLFSGKSSSQRRRSFGQRRRRRR